MGHGTFSVSGEPQFPQTFEPRAPSRNQAELALPPRKGRCSHQGNTRLLLMRPLSYVLCDVFTDRPLTGNALAVFIDAGELTAAQMQALAREMNLSESSFVI